MALIFPRLDVMTEPLSGSAAEWSQKWFGGPNRLVQSTVSMTGAVQTLLPNNPRRLFWQLTNRSASNIGVGFVTSLTLANALSMPPNAGQISMAIQEDGEAVAYEVYGIAEAAGAMINIIEIMRI